jgi:hypothetical protein
MSQRYHSSRVLAVIVLLVLCADAVQANDPIRVLDSWRAQAKGWQEYQTSVQKELNFDRAAIDRARSASDIAHYDSEFHKSSEAVLKGSPSAVKDAFNAAVKGELSLKVAKDDFERMKNTKEQQKDFIEGINSRVNQDRLEAKINALKKEIAQDEKNIEIANHVIDISQQQVARLQSSGEVWFARLPEWAQNTLNAAAQAQQRVQARKAAEARKRAEEAKKKAEEEQRRKQQQGGGSQPGGKKQPPPPEAIPAGWIECTCPFKHQGRGRYINGKYYHDIRVGLCDQ